MLGVAVVAQHKTLLQFFHYRCPLVMCGTANVKQLVCLVMVKAQTSRVLLATFTATMCCLGKV